MLQKLRGFLRDNPTSFQKLMFVIALTVLFMVIVYQALGIAQMRYSINELEDTVFEYENEVEMLVQDVERSTTERHVEEIARDRLGMVRSGEVPVQIVEHDRKEDDAKVGTNDKTGLYLNEWYQDLALWLTNEAN